MLQTPLLCYPTPMSLVEETEDGFPTLQVSITYFHFEALWPSRTAYISRLLRHFIKKFMSLIITSSTVSPR